MGLSLRPQHLRRYKEIARLLIKYGRADLVRQVGLDRALDKMPLIKPVDESRLAEELAEDLERLGPTFVKLGQLLSTRSDLLPPHYLVALSRLHDKVEPFPYEAVERIVGEELGVRVSKGFQRFRSVPIASASLGQVHRATLRDGAEVVVKVQRPNIHDGVVQDFDALQDIAEFLDEHTDIGRRYNFAGILAELRRAVLNEMDYRQEVHNLLTLHRNLEDFPNIVVPRPIDDYCSSRVLTMEYIRGVKITALSKVVLQEVDGAALADELFSAYLRQCLVDGFFHADPHPGNVLLTEDHKVALIDLGMVGWLTPRDQQQLLKLLLAISEGRGDDAADLGVAMGQPRVDFRQSEFRRRVGEIVARHRDVNVEEIEIGRLVLEIQRVAAETGIHLPRALTLIGKALLNLDRIGRELDPKFSPNASIRRQAGSILRRRMLNRVSLPRLLHAFLETTDLVEKLPERLNTLLGKLAGNELRLRVDAVDEAQLIRGIHKVANRVTAGLILAAIIVGAALLARIDTGWKLFGYPALALGFFLVAAVGGMVLAWEALFSDRRDERKMKDRH